MPDTKFAHQIVAGAAALVFLMVVWTTYYTIDQGERGVVTHYGAVVGEAEPGLHFKLPFITGITKINIQVQKLGFERNTTGGDTRMQAYSRDQQPASISLAVNYHLTSPTDVYTQYGSAAALESRVIASKALEVFKNVFGQFDAADAIQQRASLNAKVTEALQAAIKGAPALIDSVQIEDISFSQQYEQAVELRMQAIVKQQQAEAEKAQRITNADAAAYEVKAAADAQAHKTQVEGDAEAHAIQVKGQALKQNPEIVSLTTAQAWDGKLPQTMVPNGGLPFLDVRGGK
jgi:regulator of protease activity HflC (stomatin/prohibitin superfamily)